MNECKTETYQEKRHKQNKSLIVNKMKFFKSGRICSFVFHFCFCLISIFFTIFFIPDFSVAEENQPVQEGIYGNILVNKYFRESDAVSLDYSLINSANETIEMNVSIVMTCPLEPYPMPVIVPVRLNPSEVFRQSLTEHTIMNENTKQQTCKINIFNYDNGELLGKDQFSINVMPSLQVDLLTCSDINCTNSSNLFKAGDAVYIDFNPKIYNVHADRIFIMAVSSTGRTAKVRIPSSNRPLLKAVMNPWTPITRPIVYTKNSAFLAEEIGSYNLTAIINIPGYKPLRIEKKIVVSNRKK